MARGKIGTTLCVDLPLKQQDDKQPQGTGFCDADDDIDSAQESTQLLLPKCQSPEPSDFAKSYRTVNKASVERLFQMLTPLAVQRFISR